jgi:hypothetical protein
MRKLHQQTLVLLAAAATWTVITGGCGKSPPDESDCDFYARCTPDASSDTDAGGLIPGTEAGADGSGPVVCAPGQVSCQGQCVAADDVNNCGGCGKVCPGPSNGSNGSGTATCIDAGCVLTCAPNAHACGTECRLNTNSPSSDPCVVTEALGVFVSPSGNDASGKGTQQAPFATVGKGAAAAKAAGKADVFACGTFKTAVTIDASMDGRRFYGGFDCATWAWSASVRSSIAPASPGPAVTVWGLSVGVAFEAFAFTSLPATVAGGSSIAGEVLNSAGVAFAGCTFTAGAGVPGADGAGPAPAAQQPPKGNDADSTTNKGGAETVACLCPNGTPSKGGAGGAGAFSTEVPGDGTNGAPAVANNKGFGAPSVGAACGLGLVGTNGTPGANAPSPTAYGNVMNGTWNSVPGSAGMSGGTAQGGGGGGGAYSPGSTFGYGGGGGACGGCGGTGGAGGSGGGSSIAVLAIQSHVDLQSCALTTATGGAGGSGKAGQVGGPGAFHGNSPAGCPGGNGGVGGNGGTGAGGAGGVSVGIVYQGASPTVDAATQVAITIGAAGAKGTGGSSPSNDGIPGVSQRTLSLP